MFKDAALVLVALFASSVSAEPWYYRMHGEIPLNYDGIKPGSRRCDGRAEALETKDGGVQCWTWRVSRQKCTGPQRADVLYATGQATSVCRVDGKWQAGGEQATCTAVVLEDRGAVAQVSVECVYECAAHPHGNNNCGSATYQVQRAPIDAKK